MHETKLSQVDLNLLVGLDILLEVRSVTAAARQLGLSQSAMSHQLRRLRELFGDPLLVSGKGGMAPTPRAEEVHGTIRRVLAELSQTIRGGERFDPHVAKHTFVIACRDAVETLGLPAMLDFISSHAPGIRLDSRSIGTNVLAGLEEGKIDLLIDNDIERRFGARIPGLRTQVISTDDTVCLLRQGHPAGVGPLSLPEFLTLRHVVVAPATVQEDSLERRAAEAGVELDVIARISNMMAAPFAVVGADLAVVVPRRMGNHFCRLAPLTMVDVPEELRSSTEKQMGWHERFEEDSASQWLRGVIGTLTDTLNDKYAEPPAQPASGG